MNARRRYLYPSDKTIHELYDMFVSDLIADTEESQFIPSLMFQVEKAHWLYENKIVDEDHRFRSLSIKDFTYFFFKRCDPLRTYHSNHVDEILDEFNTFKNAIPVAGSIILDHSKAWCLLVKRWNSGSWSFPSGAWEDPDEDNHICAIRESMEETGYDIRPLLKFKDFLQNFEERKPVVMYIINGVDENYTFQPKIKKELSEIAWHPLSIIEKRRNKYFMVLPFLKELKTWIKRNHVPSSVMPLKETNEVSTVWKVNEEQNNWPEREFL